MELNDGGLDGVLNGRSDVLNGFPGTNHGIADGWCDICLDLIGNVESKSWTDITKVVADVTHRSLKSGNCCWYNIALNMGDGVSDEIVVP